MTTVNVYGNYLKDGCVHVCVIYAILFHIFTQCSPCSEVHIVKIYIVLSSSVSQ